MRTCDRCGVEGQGTHEFRAVGGENDLGHFRFADGSMIDGRGFFLCGGCRNELLGMLQATSRKYPDPVLPK
jgi:hypothetical protein